MTQLIDNREKVVYQAGVNEKLLGDFIKKHNVRDKVFGMFVGLEVRGQKHVI